MLIVCPTCATNYQIAPAALGAGRNVRCAQCKNTWFATAEPILEQTALAPALADAGAAPDGFTGAPVQDVLPPAPAAPDNAFAIADAPPLVPGDPPESEITEAKFDPGVPDQPEAVTAKRGRQETAERQERRGLLRGVFSLPILIIVMLATLLSALNWRATVVRHFPQTASLYAAVGLPVNLRGLFFQDVKSRNEIEDGTSVLV